MKEIGLYKGRYVIQIYSLEYTNNLQKKLLDIAAIYLVLNKLTLTIKPKNAPCLKIVNADECNRY